MPLAYQLGDIIAIHGTRLLSRMIEGFSGVISHVGCVTAIDPVMVTQALMPKVKTISLDDTIRKAQYAYALQPLKIPPDDRAAIVAYVKSRDGMSYDFADLGWQAADKIFRTQWFTIHLASDKLDICSELVAFGYGTKNYTFNVPRRQATPTEIFDYALGHPDEYKVSRI